VREPVPQVSDPRRALRERFEFKARAITSGGSSSAEVIKFGDALIIGFG